MLVIQYVSLQCCRYNVVRIFFLLTYVIIFHLIQNLTGGILLLRNKYYIVIYRGKDFLPPSVAAALLERQQMSKQIQDIEEKARRRKIKEVPSGRDEGQAPAGTLAEFYEAQARWGREISVEDRQKMIDEASKSKSVRLVKRIEHKLALVSAIYISE